MPSWMDLRFGLGSLGFGAVAIGLEIWEPGEWAIDPGIGFYIGALHAGILLIVVGAVVTGVSVVKKKQQAEA